MKFSVCINFLITISVLPKTRSQCSKPVPGSSGCGIYGSIEKFCHIPDVPVDSLPQECTSYMFYYVVADTTFEVDFGFDDTNNPKHLTGLICSGKPTFLGYGHDHFSEWVDVLQNCAQNAKTEMANLKKFLEPYQNISGIFIQSLTIEPGSDTTGLTDNFKVYIDEMRNTFPDYSIGLEILASSLSNNYAQTNPPEWMDLKVLDPSIDFYVVDLYLFNDCTDEFKAGGAFPINGSAQNTIDKVKGYITQLGVPKEKTYWVFMSGPLTTNQSDTECERTNTKLCASDSSDNYCIENTESFYNKGAYAKQYGAGFIAEYVDLVDDPSGSCKCGSPYPRFHDMLAGFNGDPVPPVCPAIDLF